MIRTIIHYAVITCLLLSPALISSAQVANKWHVTKADPNTDFQAVDVQLGPGGTVYSLGYSSYPVYEIILTKYDSLGVQLWSQAFTEPNYFTNSINLPTRLLIDQAGNAYIAASMMASTALDEDVFLIKYNSAGLFQWRTIIAGGSPGNYNDRVLDMEFDSQGNIIMGGTLTTTTSAYNHFAIVKVSPSGSEVWRNVTKVGFAYNSVTRLAIDLSDNIYAVGWDFGAGSGERMVVRKYTPAGTLDWSHTLDKDSTQSLFDYGYDIEVDAAGNAYAVGATATDINGYDKDYVTIKFDPSGSILWTEYYSSATGSRVDVPVDLWVNPLTGDAYVTGNTQDAPGSPTMSKEITTVRYSTAGLFQWAEPYNRSAGSDEAVEIVGSALPHYVIVAGTTVSNTASQSPQSVYLKYDFNGTLIWNKKWDIECNCTFPANGARSIVLGTNHYVYAVETTRESQSLRQHIGVSRFADADLFQKMHITATGSYNFGLTHAAIDILPGSDTGDINISYIHNTAANAAWCDTVPMYTSSYRWHITTTLANVTALLFLNINAIFGGHGIPDPTMAFIYKRPLDGTGIFCKQPTTYSNGVLSAPVTGFSEFIIGWDAPNGIDDLSKTDGFLLNDCYPNPSSGNTNITFELTTAADVKLVLIDQYGRQVMNIVDKKLSKGEHSFNVSKSLAAGVYHVRMTANGRSQAKSLVVM